jgi:hypothetical protein
MILIENPSKAAEAVLIPWARVSRQEANRDRQSRLRYRFHAVDALPIDFLDKFLSEELLSFAGEFAQRAALMERALFNRGTVPNLESWTWEEIKPK